MNTHTFNVGGITVVADKDRKTVQVSGDAVLTLPDASHLYRCLCAAYSIASQRVAERDR